MSADGSRKRANEDGDDREDDPAPADGAAEGGAAGAVGPRPRLDPNAPTPDPDVETDEGGGDPFQKFVESVRAKDPELEGLERGARRETIEEAERALNEGLPPLFKRFLLKWNGGTAHETCVYGVGTHDEYDLVDLNKRARENDIPDHLIGFAATVVGDVYCFDGSRRRADGDCPIVLLDPEEGEAIEAAEGFSDWLARLPNLEREVSEARGPQPMTVDEWELFLRREREKLRMLSRTPARDLPMPDPETARGNLGGKIPVDPRHLKPRGGGPL